MTKILWLIIAGGVFVGCAASGLRERILLLEARNLALETELASDGKDLSQCLKERQALYRILERAGAKAEQASREK